MLYEIKMILRVITILFGIALYVGVWVSMIKNWDKCMRTVYCDSCLESFLGNFYLFWIIMHVFGVICVFLYAWKG